MGCGTPGPALCPRCPFADRPEWVDSPAHDRVLAAGTYSGALRAAILRHKEDGVRELAAPLGDLLGDLLADGLQHVVGQAEAPFETPFETPSVRAVTLLVPVPSRAAAVRARGDDPWRRVTVRAVRALCSRGVEARLAPVLRMRSGVVDQAGLGPVERRRNLSGAMSVASSRLGRLAGRPARVVLCDDVLTTGATLAEGVRALSAVGMRPHLCVALARVAGRDGDARRPDFFHACGPVP